MIQPSPRRESIMKAYVLEDSFGLGSLKQTQRPDPSPGPGQVLVRVRAVSLNYRDLLVVKGQYDPRMPLPRIPCSDGAGEVAAVGPGVTRVRPGDRVAGMFMQDWHSGELTAARARSALGGDLDGMLAEQVVLSAEGVSKVPDHLSYEEAATLPCAALTAWNALMVQGRLTPGETVLLQGTGGVSIFALQFAKLAGARVLLTSSSDAKLARARDLGADELINYKTTPDWDRRAREMTGGTGVDHVVEVGGAGTLNRSLRAVRTAGHISLIGVLAGAGGPVDTVVILARALRVLGVYVGSREMFESMCRAVALAQMKPVIDRVFAFAEAVEALKLMESGGHFGKIVIRV
jgi:NADPH:quinone reductase-like Zn-dependent oxidoreductase